MTLLLIVEKEVVVSKGLNVSWLPGKMFSPDPSKFDELSSSVMLIQSSSKVRQHSSLNHRDSRNFPCSLSTAISNQNPTVPQYLKPVTKSSLPNTQTISSAQTSQYIFACCNLLPSALFLVYALSAR